MATELRLAIAGDTMLGRGVAERLRADPAAPLFAPELVAVVREADLFVLNLECCIAEGGERWADPEKPFFFRAPPVAAERLVELGVDCVTLANNHALDYGRGALVETLGRLREHGIAWCGAGADEAGAREPAFLTGPRGFGLAVVGVSDHPPEYAAGPGSPGIAYAELGHELPEWLTGAIGGAAAQADAVLVSPHWGPNMATRPLRRVEAAAAALGRAGATLVAGHSAHVFQGVRGSTLYDLGDFIDDYRVDPELRNDLGLLFLVTLDRRGPRALEAVPLELCYCHTRLARGESARWIARRFREACRLLGTEVGEHDGRLTVAWPPLPA